MTAPLDSVGLCRTCRHHRLVRSRRGSTFWRCLLADRDPRFPRYPALPVVACAGYERLPTDGGPGDLSADRESS